MKEATKVHPFLFSRIIILLIGLTAVIVGLQFLRFAWLGSNFVGGFLIVTGIQILFWSLHTAKMLSNSPPGVDSSIIQYLPEASVALRKEIYGKKEKNEMQFLKKWFHPIYFALALFLGGLIGHKINMWTNFGPQDPDRPYMLHSEPWMLITAISILLLVIIKDRYFETRAIQALEDITTSSREHHNKLTTWIVEHLTPTIISLDNQNKVLAQASSMITAAISEPNETEQYVIFSGSAALYQDPEDQEADADTPLSQYRTAMARIASNAISAVRYISLLEPSDYKRRGPGTRADYVKWIEKQITLIERDPHYYLYNCPRAPSWGSSRSSIFTARALLDIVGNGESGILIRGEQVAQDLAKSTKELFETRAIVKPVVYDKPMLINYLKKLEDELSDASKEKDVTG